MVCIVRLFYIGTNKEHQPIIECHLKRLTVVKVASKFAMSTKTKSIYVFLILFSVT